MGERKKKYILTIKGRLIISKNPVPENPMAKSSIKTISSEVFSIDASKLFYVYLSCTRFLISISYTVSFYLHVNPLKVLVRKGLVLDLPSILSTRFS